LVLEALLEHTLWTIWQKPAFTQIDKRYYDKPYYIVPNDEVGVEAFAVIREAMTGKGMAALGCVVMSKRERVIAIEPRGKGLRGGAASALSADGGLGLTCGAAGPLPKNRVFRPLPTQHRRRRARPRP
jgi:Ku70/Ku80 beta-barrel domain